MNSAGTLYIGNRNYSSWPLRAWLLLRHFQVPMASVLAHAAMRKWYAEAAAEPGALPSMEVGA